jgi:hypothetical protein
MNLDGRTPDDLLEMLLPIPENTDLLESGQRYMVLLPAIYKLSRRKGGQKMITPSRLRYLRFDRYSTVPCKFVDTEDYPHTKYLMNEISCYFKLKKQDGI